MRKVKPWSTKVKGYVIAYFRRIHRWSPLRRQVLASKQCALCGTRTTDLQADHKEPVTEIGKPTFEFDEIKGFSGLDNFGNRMFLGAMQALCLPCHQAKSKKENALRREIKKARKDKAA